MQYRLRSPIEYRLELMKAGFERIVGGGAQPIRFLIISDGVAHSSEQQFAPLRRYAAELRKKLGVAFRFMRLSDGVRLNPGLLSRFSAVGLKLFFRSEAAVSIVAQFRERLAGTETKLVYFDGDDDVCVQWPEILALVDLYVKKGMFAQEQDYLRQYVGKCNLTDYVWKVHGIAPVATAVQKSGVVDRAHLGKLHLGWSMALDDSIAQLLKKPERIEASSKDLDVVCRMSVPGGWLFALRSAVIPPLEALSQSYRVVLPSTKVPRDQYYQEMRRARICVSPLGYGEVCWRDFEAIACGCLLVKPDVSHLRTDPDLFVPGETYVPVRWDYADLVETCARYLADKRERSRIASNAYRVLSDSHRDGSFVGRFANLLDRAGLRGVAWRRLP